MSKVSGNESYITKQRRRQILDATKACIAEMGIAKTTLREVADRIGVTHGVIGYHFKDRSALINEAIREMAEAFLNEAEQECESFPDPKAKLRELVEHVLELNSAGTTFAMQVIDAGIHDPDLRTPHYQFLEFGRKSIERLLADGIQSGDFRPDMNPRLASMMLHSVLVWWGLEVGAGAASPYIATEVALQALLLMDGDYDSRASAGPRRESTLDVLEACLRDDERISSDAAANVMAAFERIYALAVDG